MSKVIDLTGIRFGKLVVQSRAENTKEGRAQWNCLCDCKKTCVVRGKDLTRKDGKETRSCGCLHRESLVERNKTHGLSGEPTYNLWCGINQRCNNPNNQDYKHYGGRGITICDEWENDFDAFYEYVSKLEHFGEDGYSLDRIDNSKGYELGNVRFATPKEQVRNRRVTLRVEYQGVEIPLAEAAELIGIKYNTLKRRYYRGKERR